MEGFLTALIFSSEGRSTVNSSGGVVIGFMSEDKV